MTKLTTEKQIMQALIDGKTLIDEYDDLYKIINGNIMIRHSSFSSCSDYDFCHRSMHDILHSNAIVVE